MKDSIQFVIRFFMNIFRWTCFSFTMLSLLIAFIDKTLISINNIQVLMVTSLFFSLAFSGFYLLLFPEKEKITHEELCKKLNYGFNVNKRLDEHRELVQFLEENTDILQKYPWVKCWLGTQDDYLMRLYYIVHGFFPPKAYLKPSVLLFVRNRPSILAACDLPEYLAEKPGDKNGKI